MFGGHPGGAWCSAAAACAQVGEEASSVKVQGIRGRAHSQVGVDGDLGLLGAAVGVAKFGQGGWREGRQRGRGEGGTGGRQLALLDQGHGPLGSRAVRG